LVSQFLHDMDGKALGAMDSGPYGILSGLGIALSEATDFLEKLDHGHFVLVVRGYDFELELLKSQLEELGPTE